MASVGSAPSHPGVWKRREEVFPFPALANPASRRKKKGVASNGEYKESLVKTIQGRAFYSQLVRHVFGVSLSRCSRSKRLQRLTDLLYDPKRVALVAQGAQTRILEVIQP